MAIIKASKPAEPVLLLTKSQVIAGIDSYCDYNNMTGSVVHRLAIGCAHEWTEGHVYYSTIDDGSNFFEAVTDLYEFVGVPYDMDIRYSIINIDAFKPYIISDAIHSLVGSKIVAKNGLKGQIVAIVYYLNRIRFMCNDGKEHFFILPTEINSI